MRVFVTGSTGFIGSAIVRELLEAGHLVLGLARSTGRADELTRQGASAHAGDLSDADSLMAGAQACDGVIHTAFVHDFSRYREAGEIDRRAVEAMTQAYEGSSRPLVITSGTSIVAPGALATENQPARGDSPSGVRAPSEHALADAAQRGVRGIVVRLPSTVHGKGDHGFVPALVEIARRTGVSAYINDGANRWPAVHRVDAARLFRLALENGAAGTLHGAAEAGIPMRDIAATIGRGLGVDVRSVSAEDASTHFDWLARFVAIDNPTSSSITRNMLNWQPKEPGLLADMRDGGYF